MPDINALLNPTTVAVVGASNNKSIIRGRAMEVLLSHPFKGRIYPISRSAQQIQGLKAFSSVELVPEQIDLALIIIPAEFILEELERCGNSGVKAAQIITSGFAEGGGRKGKKLQLKISEIANKFDMAISGPNSEGFANTLKFLCPTFSPAVAETSNSLTPEYRKSGFVAAIAQSGGSGFGLYDQGRPNELPFSYVITTGNEAALETFHFVDYLLDDGKTDAFLLFLEDVKTPALFERTAEKALRAGKPIILTKIGKSEAGRRAAQSHTGAMTGTYDAYKAMFQRYGIIEGKDREEMCDIAAGFSHFGSRLPLGKRVGICSGSGGSAGWMAETCTAIGLEVPLLDDATRNKIDSHLPHYATSQNPVDATAGSIRKIGYSVLGEWVSRSPVVDSIIIVTSARHAHSFSGEGDHLARIAREAKKPIMMCTYTSPSPESTLMFNKAGYPFFTNMPNCARTVREMADYKILRDAFLKVPEIRTSNPAREQAVRKACANQCGVLTEYETGKILGHYDINLGGGGLAKSAEDAIAIAKEIAGPVALKVQSPNIPHKSDVGGVILNLETQTEIKDSFSKILSSAKQHCPSADLDGVLVKPMAKDGVEFILGLKHDDVFGMMMLVGLGGVFVEVLQDRVVLPTPISIDEGLRALSQLKGSAILDGVRGRPTADKIALAELMVKLSHFGSDFSDIIAEIDLNPVIVHEEGHGVTIVDGLIVTFSGN